MTRNIALIILGVIAGIIATGLMLVAVQDGFSEVADATIAWSSLTGITALIGGMLVPDAK